MKKNIIILMVAISMVCLSYSQEAQPIKWPNNIVGAQASMFTGYGLVFGYHWSDAFMTKINIYGLGAMNNPPPDEQSILTTIGLEMQYTMMRTKFTRFAIFAAASHWYDETTQYFDNSVYNTTAVYITKEDISRTIQFGLGFCLELLAWNRVGFSFEGGYMAKFSSNTGSRLSGNRPNYILTPEASNPIWMGFGVGASVTYGF